jgi:uncharacterized protein (TIRG00374 family)
VLVGFAISALAVYLLLQQVKPEDVSQALSRVAPGPVALIVLTVLASLVTRAARWQVLFLPNRRVGFAPLLGTLSISYMASTLLPLRAGELVRAVFLGGREGIAVPRVVSTILIEKLFDFLAIGVMTLVLVFIPSVPAEARAAGAFIGTVIFVGFGFVVALAVWREPTLRLVRFVQDRLPGRLGAWLRLEQVVGQFVDGTDALRSGRVWSLLLGWTVVTWLCAIGSCWAGLVALGIEPRLESLLSVVVLTSAGQAVPSSPGYVGVYHFWASEALKAFGVEQSLALAFAVLTHAFSYGTLVIVGLVALWTGGYSAADVLAAVRGSPQPSLSPAPQP